MPGTRSPTAGQRARDAFTGHPWRTVAIAVALALVVLALLWDWNWFKGPVERAVEARTGRSFDIGGDLEVDLGRTTPIRADRLQLGNADWSKQARMASAARPELRNRPFAPLRVRKSVVEGKRVDVRVDLGVRRAINKT